MGAAYRRQSSGEKNKRSSYGASFVTALKRRFNGSSADNDVIEIEKDFAEKEQVLHKLPTSGSQAEQFQCEDTDAEPIKDTLRVVAPSMDTLRITGRSSQLPPDLLEIDEELEREEREAEEKERAEDEAKHEYLKQSLSQQPFLRGQHWQKAVENSGMQHQRLITAADSSGSYEHVPVAAHRRGCTVLGSIREGGLTRGPERPPLPNCSRSPEKAPLPPVPNSVEIGDESLRKLRAAFRSQETWSRPQPAGSRSSHDHTCSFQAAKGSVNQPSRRQPPRPPEAPCEKPPAPPQAHPAVPLEAPQILRPAGTHLAAGKHIRER
jgi:hypothetical protein